MQLPEAASVGLVPAVRTSGQLPKIDNRKSRSPSWLVPAESTTRFLISVAAADDSTRRFRRDKPATEIEKSDDVEVLVAVSCWLRRDEPGRKPVELEQESSERPLCRSRQTFPRSN